jgi:glyoxylase-like metal-dependent hydrolase (beta-lactamase superfamily II)
MTGQSVNTQPQSAFHDFKKISTAEDWFEVYEIAHNLFAFYEPRHYEQTIVNLVIGEQGAVLIDTGCGIGNLRSAVREVTDKPLMVINTHTHSDHLGSNAQFDQIVMYDHPLSRRAAERGVSHQTLEKEILADFLVTKPWPNEFDPGGFSIPPFPVSRWLKDGKRSGFGGLDFEVIHTPGEAPDHVCLLDRTNHLLFCGDILLHGPVWTHLEGGSLEDLARSYRRLMNYFDEFDHLMPGHNQPYLEKDLLPETLAAAEKILSGQAESRDIVDPWYRRLKQYDFGRFQILTPQ